MNNIALTLTTQVAYTARALRSGHRVTAAVPAWCVLSAPASGATATAKHPHRSWGGAV
jgi:hypothetical protein